MEREPQPARVPKIPTPLSLWWERDSYGDWCLWVLPQAGTFDADAARGTDGSFVCARMLPQTSGRWDAWSVGVRPAIGFDGGVFNLRCSLKEAKRRARELYEACCAKVRLGVRVPEWTVFSPSAGDAPGKKRPARARR